MLFSSKLTNSVLTYLERRGLSLEELYSCLDVPEEFLRDPSSWLSAKDVEFFLSTTENLFSARLKDELAGEGLVQKIGHECAELRSWGVLDGVLRMMPGPQELYSQPGRFISYFVSPEPIVSHLTRSNDKESFQLSLSTHEYPYFTTYLGSALEALPSYVGKPFATVDWKDREVTVSWAEDQENLFTEKDQVINPELLRTLVQSLEKNQKELEKRNRELMEKNKELQDAQRRLQVQMKEQKYTEKLSGFKELAASVAHEIKNPLSYSTSNVHRLNDYFARAQQLVTILIGQNRETPQVREAMRRLDWEYITEEHKSVVDEAFVGLKRVSEIVKDLSFLAGKSLVHEKKKTSTDINSVVQNAIKMVGPQKPANVSIDTHLFMDRQVPVYPIRLEQALVNIVSSAFESIPGNGTVRVSTRPKGQKAEIEIADTGDGFDDATMTEIFKPWFSQDGKGTGLGLSIARSIVEMHDGRIDVSSRPGEGTTYTVELPS